MNILVSHSVDQSVLTFLIVSSYLSSLACMHKYRIGVETPSPQRRRSLGLVGGIINNLNETIVPFSADTIAATLKVLASVDLFESDPERLLP